MGGSLDNEFHLGEPHGYRFNKLTYDPLGAVLLTSLDAAMIVGDLEKSMLAGAERRQQPGFSQTPDRVLLFGLARVVQRPFLSQARHQRRHVERAHRHHKFLTL